ncbi:hypothetical protein ACFOQM_19480 [Paenibacillus sp. GCM10012307]|uniref:Uncharacterized protein n=1 Tax=Paenibacillus roseus TaxID=2798579 RepID=A0A934J251_9BACL|nr:hypothetical protein [Paenibacillus roseus]MBJ6363406.1 hypothetical protein [Paenibacillus roseus]
MFKERSFVLGLGLGVMAGVLLLQLMISADVQQTKADWIASEVSEAKGPKESSNEANGGESQELSRLKQEIEALKQEQEKQQGEQQKAVEEALAKQRSELEAERENNSRIWAVTIRKGMGMKEIGILLEDAALVEDASAFLKETRLSRNRIRNGKYYFTGFADYDEIKKTLLRDPLLSRPVKEEQ